MGVCVDLGVPSLLGATLATYLGLSLVLLRWPHLLHGRKKLTFVARHISHRGGAGERLENSMSAFRNAVQCNTEMLELDCHLTKDGHVVVSHDNHLQRLSGRDIRISDTDFKDLPPLLPELEVDFHQGQFVTGSDRQIVLLRDVFRSFPQLPINVDIKMDSDELIAQVSSLVHEFGREEITVWGNFRHSVTQKCYRQNTSIGLLFSIRRVFWLLVWFYSGLLGWLPLHESFLEIPMPSVLMKGAHLSWSQRLLLRVASFLLLRPALFRHLQRRGCQVFLWVLNNEDEYQRAFDLGASGVMTDYPSRLRAFLDSQGQLSQDS